MRGALLHAWESTAGETGYFFWCPACKGPHSFRTKAPTGRPTWEFDGNSQRPTFKPSLLCFTTVKKDGEETQPPVRRTICHLFVRDGQIEYCGDSPHELSGKTVQMVPYPDEWK